MIGPIIWVEGLIGAGKHPWSSGMRVAWNMDHQPTGALLDALRRRYDR